MTLQKNGLKINGAEQISQDIYFDTTQFKDGVDFPVTVGSGQVFILGDNRPQASDSRIYGCIDIKDVKGKVIAIIRSRGNLITRALIQIKNKIIYKGGTKMSMKKFTKKMLAIVAAGAMTMGMANAGNGSGSNNDRHKK